MSSIWRGACALLMAALACVAAPAQETLATVGDVAEPGVESELLLTGGYDTGGYDFACDSCNEPDCFCESGCTPSCGVGCGSSGICSGGQLVVGAEFLSVRATFSEATAYLDSNLATTPGSYDYVQYDFDYSESFRTYIGWRLCQCDGEIRFTYTDIDTGGSFDSGLLDTNGATRSFTSPFEVVTAGDGDRLLGTASVELQDYDLGFSRNIPLGSPLSCCDCGDTCCGDCGDTCCGPRCAAWDITWSGALRYTNIESRLGYQSIIDPANTTASNRTAESVVQFDGVGIRTGLLGRRYIGKRGVASVYVKGDISLLLGEVDYYAVGTAFARHQISTTQVIPVTEIEAGGTVYLTKRISASAGYLLSVWHDLGHRAMYDFGITGVQLEGMDDANMMSLDGWFARVEAVF